MLKLMIVDDEKVTREGLKNCIDWEALGIRIVGEAEDGIQALELFRQLRPDLILCDVRMPRMNGIDFSAEAKSLLPFVQIIFLSGYSDKEYLKSAIRLNVVDYIEKPVDEADLLAAVDNAIKKHNKEKEGLHLNQKVQKGLDLMRNNFALELVMEGTSEDHIRQSLELLGVNMDISGWFCTAIVKFHPVKLSSMEEMNVLKEQFMHILASSLWEPAPAYWGAIVDDGCIVHFRFPPESSDRNLEAFASLLEKCMTAIPDAKNMIAIGIGVPVSKMSDLHISYKGAYSAVKGVFFKGFGKIIFATKLNTSAYSLNNNFIKEYFEYIQNDDVQTAMRLVEELTGKISHHEGTDIHLIKNMYTKILLQLFDIMKQKRIAMEDMDQDRLHLLHTIDGMATLWDIRDYFMDKMKPFLESVENFRNKSRITYEIEKFIQDHYDEDLSLKTIADAVFLTPTYLCSIFKKETHKTINQYITEVKVEKAKELLRDKSLKLYEIAGKVGYSDQNYFAKVFSKAVGLNPSEYREKFL